MTRGDSVIAGTTTTGTGTLTLAACPTPPGGVDFDVLCRALGFVNNATAIVSYTIIEYTDTTFATAKQHEKGFGVLTLGASAGIANCTLARTTKQSSATSLDGQPATQNFVPGTGITIVTAANVLVFIGPSVMDMPAYVPYYDTTQGNNVSPVGCVSATTGQSLNPNQHYYNAFEWRIPMLVKRCQTAVWAPVTGGTSDAYAALYGIGTDGRPGRLLIDFGTIGTPGASLSSGFTSISSAIHSTGFFLMPGEYYFNFRYTITGTAGTIQTIASPGERLRSGRLGSAQGFPSVVAWSDASGALTPAPNPAYLNGWSVTSSQNWDIVFSLAPS